ncbi:MAG TPA: HAD family hydrolase [Caldimonas sp.]|nr:HAD family hydrolase [Caldimonas sp.]
MSLTLVSFDIDGTLECGQPPGVVPLALVETAKRLGYVVGSCSDRPIAYQQALWSALGIAVDFTILKHRLGELKARFTATAYYHIGDAEADARYASDAGFRFLKADVAGHAAWALELFGTSA